MPFTPFHMGPGLLVKALLQGSFSLMVFGWAQVIMDIQPLIVILTGEGHLHGFTHTYVGATLIGLACAVTGKYAAEFGLRLIGCPQFLPVRWPVAIVSAFIGSYSHVLIDSLMHADMAPLAPFSDVNPLLHGVPVDTLHQICVYSGIVGAGLYFAVARWLVSRRAGLKPEA
jgi:membrane-bound metal-dependent hydrolase YbcI (DUF457 family)